jgi:putative peptidoglycan lipid II flippase
MKAVLTMGNGTELQSLAANRDNQTGSVIGKLSLVKTVFGLSAIAFLAKVFGFTEKVIIAHFFGTSDGADVYFASTGIVLSIVYIVKSLTYPSLLPVFASSLRGPPAASRKLFRKAFLWAAFSLAIIASVLAAFPGFVTGMLVPGFAESKHHTTSSLLRMLAPSAFFLSLTMVTYPVLNASKRFMSAAWPRAALKLFIVLGLIALLPVLGLYALAVVIGLGALGCLLAHLCFIPEHKFLFRREQGLDGAEHFRKVLLLMAPLALGAVFSQASGLVDNLLASRLPTGQLSYLGYSRKLIDAILLVGPVALVTVVFSQLSHLASSNDREEFASLFIKAFRLLLYLSMPVACLLIGLREPLIRLLFQHGQFRPESTFGTSQAFMVYALGLVVFSLETLIVHSFYALPDTKTPTLFGVLCVLLRIGLAILLLRPFGYLGIAVALVISKTVKTIILVAILKLRIRRLFDSTIMVFSAKVAITTGAVWLAVRFILGIHNTDSVFHTAILDLMLPVAGGLLAFVLCSHLLRIGEFKAVVSLLRYRKAAVDALYGEANGRRDSNTLRKEE